MMILILVLLLIPTLALSQITKPIKVDQFGYRPADSKLAVIADPQTGFNSADSYTIGGTLAVKEVGSGTTVYSGAPVAWNAGATHTQSGDKVWRFDFTSLATPGTYYVQDLTTGSQSDLFVIRQDVYLDVLKAAVKMLYYQRSGYAKVAPYADSRWADGAAFLGTGQDTEARSALDQANAGTAKDLRGGWFDAGDYNKYTVYACIALQDLLLAYEEQPGLFGDNWGWPESGNGIPDILDEVKWELDWLLRMQQGDGSVLSKVSALTTGSFASPPSADTTLRYWGAASTPSTALSAGIFALASKIFAGIGQTAYAATLQTAAVNAWTWAAANPAVSYPNTGFTTANAETALGDAAYSQPMSRLVAAAYLYTLTGSSTYKTYFEANYTTAHALAWTYWGPFEAWLQASLLYYSKQSGITAGVASAIHASKVSSIGGSEFYAAITSDTDAYLSYIKDADWTWGSNQTKAQVGNLYLDLVRYTLDSANHANYTRAAGHVVHYLHGVNAVATVFLSNMYALGAERAVNEIYHVWFDDGTNWDNALTSLYGPAPGYLAGGPNPTYSGTQTPPLAQPIQKAWRDFNGNGTTQAYQITEPGIYYQAAYVRLLAAFVSLAVAAGTGGAFSPPPLPPYLLHRQHALMQGLVAWYPVWPHLAAGATWWDQIGEHHGTLVNGATWSAETSGRFAGAVRLDGTDDYVTIADHAHLDFGTGNFSACAHILLRSPLVANSDYPIFSKTTNFEGAPGWVVEAATYGVGSTSVFELDMGITTTVAYTYGWLSELAPTSLTLPTDVVHHVCATRSGATLTLYANGQVYNTGGFVDATDLTVDNAEPLWLGTAPMAGFDYLPGSLMYPMLFNRALSATDVAWLATCRAPDFCGLALPEDVVAQVSARRQKRAHHQ